MVTYTDARLERNKGIYFIFIYIFSSHMCLLVVALRAIIISRLLLVSSVKLLHHVGELLVISLSDGASLLKRKEVKRKEVRRVFGLSI
jgi:hypothetical protein